MSISQRALDICVIEGFLYERQVAGPAQKLGAEVVPEIMEPEADDSCLLS